MIRMNEFENLRGKWNEILIGSNDQAVLNPETQRLVNDIEGVAKGWLDAFEHNNSDYIWEDKQDFNQTQTQTDCYRRLFEMSKAYTMKGSHFYQDGTMLEAILEGLYFIYTKAYNPSASPYYGNWWNWEIGNPIILGNILSLLGDNIPADHRQKYCETIRFFQPDPYFSGLRRKPDNNKQTRTSVGANRIDTAKVAMLLGINDQDKKQLAMARDSISDTFIIIDQEKGSTATDGLYQDWSYIQHEDVAYTGTYGNVLLGGIGELVNALSGTSWEIKDPNIENIYQMIIHSFQPLMYKGHVMECVNGRGASRQFMGDNGTGHGIISSVLWFTRFAPKEYADQYKQMVKRWILEDEVRDFIKTTDNVMLLEIAKEITEDTRISPRGELVGNFAFNSMDRMVHRTPSFTAALSMNSKRVRTYEFMLEENKKGYYTGDGKLDIYNGDQFEYTHDYWATINPYKLTGITLDTKALEDGGGYHRSPEAWVSNMNFKDKIGIAGMQLNKEKIEEMDLKAKKSYFMLDHEIVALGTDISSSKDRKVETIVDTRKIKKDRSNKLIMEDDYIYLEGNRKDYSMGYYFPYNQAVEVERYTRAASWNEVNDNGDTQIKEQDYVTISIDHGRQVTDGEYAYLMIPNAKEDGMRDYLAKREIEIIANTKDVQAIKYKQITMANFWRDQKHQLKQIEVSTQASVIIEDGEDQIDIAICDPTKENQTFIDMTINSPGAEILEKSEAIEVIAIGQTIELRIHTKDEKGKKATIAIKK